MDSSFVYKIYCAWPAYKWKIWKGYELLHDGMQSPFGSCVILDKEGGVQIRRYVYCNVVRSADIQRYIDISGIQNYIVNSTKVVFLESRPQSKTFKPNSTERCRTCRRYLREGCRYCSLHCKVFEDSPNMWSQEERSSATCVSCNSSVQEDGPLAGLTHTTPCLSKEAQLTAMLWDHGQHFIVQPF
eukprot:jgi/Botrbrau1/11036/Bobra.92_2s0009.1